MKSSNLLAFPFFLDFPSFFRDTCDEVFLSFSFFPVAKKANGSPRFLFFSRAVLFVPFELRRDLLSFASKKAKGLFFGLLPLPKTLRFNVLASFSFCFKAECSPTLLFLTPP